MHCVERREHRRQLADALDHLLRRDASKLSRRRPARVNVEILGRQKDGQIMQASFDSNYLSVHSVSREAQSGCEEPSNNCDDSAHVLGGRVSSRVALTT